MSTFSPSHYFAARIENRCASLLKLVDKMPADRREWKPSPEGIEGRSAINQALEIAWMNDLGAGMFGSNPDILPSWDQYYADTAAHEAAGDWQPWLTQSAARFAESLRAFPAEKWSTAVLNPFTRKEETWAELFDLFYWNLCYHIGQISYIQVLYGDKD